MKLLRIWLLVVAFVCGLIVAGYYMSAHKQAEAKEMEETR